MTFSSFSKKVHCIHILWCIFMGHGHNDPWVASHIRPQQMWGQRSSRGQWPLVGNLQKGHCIHILWCIFIGLGHNDPWVESHMWPQKMWHQRSSRGQWPLLQAFCKKGQCIHILWCIFMGLGHNDPWVESHIRPQQMWGQRSSRGQWPLVQVFPKAVTVSTTHTLMYVQARLVVPEPPCSFWECDFEKLAFKVSYSYVLDCADCRFDRRLIKYVRNKQKVSNINRGVIFHPVPTSVALISKCGVIKQNQSEVG